MSLVSKSQVLSKEWSDQEQEDLDEYKDTLLLLVKGGFISMGQAKRMLMGAIHHTVKHRCERLPDEIIAPEHHERLDLGWVLSQTDVDPDIGYLLFLKEELGSWRQVGVALNRPYQAILRSIRKRTGDHSGADA